MAASKLSLADLSPKRLSLVVVSAGIAFAGGCYMIYHLAQKKKVSQSVAPPNPEVPCNWEFEKSIFFRKLNPETTDETMRTLLEKTGPLDYCYIGKDEEGNSKKIGRAKFRAVGDVGDIKLSRDQQILKARQRAVDNANAAVKALDKSTVDGKEIRVAVARAADEKEFTRYGDY